MGNSLGSLQNTHQTNYMDGEEPDSNLGSTSMKAKSKSLPNGIASNSRYQDLYDPKNLLTERHIFGKEPQLPIAWASVGAADRNRENNQNQTIMPQKQIEEPKITHKQVNEIKASDTILKKNHSRELRKGKQFSPYQSSEKLVESRSNSSLSSSFGSSHFSVQRGASHQSLGDRASVKSNDRGSRAERSNNELLQSGPKPSKLRNEAARYASENLIGSSETVEDIPRDSYVNDTLKICSLKKKDPEIASIYFKDAMKMRPDEEGLRMGSKLRQQAITKYRMRKFNSTCTLYVSSATIDCDLLEILKW